MLYFLFKHVCPGPFMMLLSRPRVTGRENIPKTGGVIVAGNHLAVADSFVVPLVMPRRVIFLGKAEYLTGTGLVGRARAIFFGAIGMVPVQRDDASAASASVDVVIEHVERGMAFGIYPEGTRSPDGRLYKGRTGVAKVALATGAPVLPVAVIGTDKLNPVGSKMWRPHRIEIHFGKPLEFSRYDGLAGDRWAERAIVDQIMTEIVKLSGQEYVDAYASSVKEQQG
ncbi:lysophospholipid acyltransferase family protein [Rhodococcus sp. X156]|uniref:lysophospholipid acyltransferase family protein n=1 Tax=Rhodococcus sp. X156 TaxID=2499145 RepID=UPI000FDB2E60|nr:lysophospholipid acyltransferase family protein [Rhodococcus sp. X156]